MLFVRTVVNGRSIGTDVTVQVLPSVQVTPFTVVAGESVVPHATPPATMATPSPLGYVMLPPPLPQSAEATVRFPLESVWMQREGVADPENRGTCVAVPRNVFPTSAVAVDAFPVTAPVSGPENVPVVVPGNVGLLGMLITTLPVEADTAI